MHDLPFNINSCSLQTTGGRTAASFHSRFRPRHRLPRSQESLGLARSCGITARARKDAPKKEWEEGKHKRGKLTNVEEKLDTSTDRGNSAHRKAKQVSKGFAALADLVAQVDGDSSLLTDGQKSASRKNVAVRVRNYSAISAENVRKLQYRDSADKALLSKADNIEETSNSPEQKFLENFIAQGRSKADLSRAFLSTMTTVDDEKESSQPQTPTSLWNQKPSAATSPPRQSPQHESKKTEDIGTDDGAEQPSLRGQEILLAMQRAAMEKAKLKQKNVNAYDRVGKSKENPSPRGTLDWRDARPIILRPEWASQIEDLERRIKDLKNHVQP